MSEPRWLVVYGEDVDYEYQAVHAVGDCFWWGEQVEAEGCGGASPHNFEMGFYFADSCIDHRPI